MKKIILIVLALTAGCIGQDYRCPRGPDIYSKCKSDGTCFFKVSYYNECKNSSPQELRSIGLQECKFALGEDFVVLNWSLERGLYNAASGTCKKDE